MQAANYIQALEERQGLMVACLEEIAYPHGLHLRQRSRCAWPARWRRAPTGGICFAVLEQEHVIVRVVPTAAARRARSSSPTSIATAAASFSRPTTPIGIASTAFAGPFVAGQPFAIDRPARSAGLHLQLERPQGKLIHVVEGEVFDVAVDVRRGSPTFGRWFGIVLSAENFKQCYVRPGFAHGFCVLSPMAQVDYKCTDFYDPGGRARDRLGRSRPGD